MYSFYQLVIFIHVLALFTFALSHGTSIVFSFRIKSEKELIRIQAMFDMSSHLWFVMIISLLVLAICGIILGFLGQWWSSWWIWISLFISVGITVWMFVLGQGTYSTLRKAFGLPYTNRGKEMPPVEPISESERMELINHTRPWVILLSAFGGFAIILWLMMFKPF